MESDPCVLSENQWHATGLAKIVLFLSRNPDLGSRRDLPCQLDVPLRQIRAVVKGLFGVVEKNVYPFSSNRLDCGSHLSIVPFWRPFSHETLNLAL